jgi:hypothetical protein
VTIKSLATGVTVAAMTDDGAVGVTFLAPVRPPVQQAGVGV